MPIRHLVLALPIAACLDVAEPALTERQDGVICTPLCTPGYQPILDATYSFGYRVFPDAGMTFHQDCAEIGAGWDCIVVMQTSGISGGAAACSAVECQQQGAGQSPRCRTFDVSCSP